MNAPKYLGTCPNCKLPYRETLYDTVELHCSEFCNIVAEAERTLWHNYKQYNSETDEADFGLYPCQECGQVIEDEFMEPRICWTCVPKVKARRRTELLKNVLRESVSFNLISSDLLNRIREELGNEE